MEARDEHDDAPGRAAGRDRAIRAALGTRPGHVPWRDQAGVGLAAQEGLLVQVRRAPVKGTGPRGSILYILTGPDVHTQLAVVYRPERTHVPVEEAVQVLPGERVEAASDISLCIEMRVML